MPHDMSGLHRIAIVGAGFSGAVIAHQLAAHGHRVSVFESRDHIAGNCHTFRDPETSVLLHVYGPHIFHTKSDRVWDYIRQFDNFRPFVNRVKAHAKGRVYSLPINLLTINQLFNRQFSPAEARTFIRARAEQHDHEPVNFEEQALQFVGREIYETFFKGYTKKQWGVDPTELPASILKRLPLRFDYEDNYYSDPYQGMPEHGYTHIVERMLDHPLIEVNLSTQFHAGMRDAHDHVFYSGPIDAWFDRCAGGLRYRTLDFERIEADGDIQGNAVINYCDAEVPWTRICEHQHFAPWERHERSIAYREYSRECTASDIPYYPLRLVHDKNLLAAYVDLARNEQNVTFVGRLGTYRYLDMDVTIGEALNTAQTYLDCLSHGRQMPAFVQDPLGT